MLKSAAEPTWRLWPIVIAGEAIFVLPFVVPRLFKPLMIEQWGTSNAVIGGAMSVYGFVAVAGYFLGGPIADRFSPRIMMPVALITTAAIGGLMLGRPSATALFVAYAGFGLSTILLFWSAMIRATRHIGGRDASGWSFGLLDAGRGLFAAVLATALSWSMGDEPSLDRVVAVAMAVVVLTAIIVGWTPITEDTPPIMKMNPRNLAVNDSPAASMEDPATNQTSGFRWSMVQRVLQNQRVWQQGIVLLCAYIGYKSVDHFGVLLVDRHQYDPSQAATLTSRLFWLRPPMALMAGYFADRVSPFAIMVGLFALMAAGSAAIIPGFPLTGTSSAGWVLPVVASMAIAAASVYAMRAIYFAVMDDLDVPLAMTGTAAGIISTVGFLPDIFFGAITGYWIDHSVAGDGYRLTFGLVAAAALVGAAISLYQHRTIHDHRRSVRAPD